MTIRNKRDNDGSRTINGVDIVHLALPGLFGGGQAPARSATVGVAPRSAHAPTAAAAAAAPPAPSFAYHHRRQHTAPSSQQQQLRYPPPPYTGGKHSYTVRYTAPPPAPPTTYAYASQPATVPGNPRAPHLLSISSQPHNADPEAVISSGPSSESCLSMTGNVVSGDKWGKELRDVERAVQRISDLDIKESHTASTGESGEEGGAEPTLETPVAIKHEINGSTSEGEGDQLERNASPNSLYHTPSDKKEGCCGKFKSTQFYKGSSYIFNLLSFIMPLFSVLNWYFDWTIFTEMWSWQESQCQAMLESRWDEDKLKDFGYDASVHSRQDIFARACEAMKSSGSMNVEFAGTTLSLSRSQVLALVYISILLLSLRHQTLFFIIRHPSFPYFDKFSKWRKSVTLAFFVPIFGSFFYNQKSIARHNKRLEEEDPNRVGCLGVIQGGIFIEIISWVSIPFMMIRQVLWVLRVFIMDVSGVGDSSTDYIIKASNDSKHRRRSMLRSFRSSQPEESHNNEESKRSSFFKRIISTNNLTFSAKEEEVAPIYWRGITFKKLLSYVGLWGVFEAIGQLIVLIIHEHYTDSELTETIESALLTFAPTKSLVPSSSPYPTESYRPTNLSTDPSTPYSKNHTPMPASFGPTITIYPTPETMDTIVSSYSPTAGGTQTVEWSLTISPTIGTVDRLDIPVPTYPTPMPTSSSPTASNNPTTETMDTNGSSLSPTWGGIQTSGESLTGSPTSFITSPTESYWVPNWHNAEFSEGTCVSKDGWYGMSEALPKFADQLTCCEVAFKDQESQACLREAGVLSDKVYWFPDYSVAYSVGTCQNRTGSTQPDMPHFRSQQQCCMIAFDNQKPEICLKQLPGYSTSFESMSDAYKYSEWAFAFRAFTSALSIVYTLYKLAFSNIRKEMRAEQGMGLSRRRSPDEQTMQTAKPSSTTQTTENIMSPNSKEIREHAMKMLKM